MVQYALLADYTVSNDTKDQQKSTNIILLNLWTYWLTHLRSGGCMGEAEAERDAGGA
jgi:hypothetical protein